MPTPTRRKHYQINLTQRRLPHRNAWNIFSLQVKVSRMVGLAFALSITGIGGIGSFVALVLGWRALRIIKAESGRISGRWMAWWCILAGALGTLILTPLVIADILRSVK
jgi:hypothetical protein